MTKRRDSRLSLLHARESYIKDTSREGTTWGIYIDTPHCGLSFKGGYMDILPMLYYGIPGTVG